MMSVFFCLLVFLTPLLVIPWTSELFELNKMTFVFLMTAIIVAAWLIRMILAKKILFRHTFWDWPLLIFLISQFLSWLTSIDKHTSWWGYYGRFNGGLLSSICYALLYWAYVSNVTKKETRQVIRWWLIGAAITAGYGIAQHYGIDDELWVQDVKSRVFATLGQPNWLAAYLVATMPLSWHLMIKKSKNPLSYLLSLISCLCLLFTKSRSGLLGFGVAFTAFWGLNLWQKRGKILKPFLFLVVSLGLITLTTRYQPHQTNNQIEKNNPEPLLISKSSDIRRVVWRGALDIWQHHPLLGTGPETFAYTYYWFRPREHNDLSEWDFLYNKAHNEFLNYAANTGAIGLLGYLILIFSFLTAHFKFQFRGALLASFASILVTNFFGFSVVPVNLLFFLLPALATPLDSENLPPKKATGRQKFLIILVLSLLLVVGYQLSCFWLADLRFAKAKKLSQAGEEKVAFKLLQTAVKIRPNEPVYQDALAISAAKLGRANLASAFSSQALAISPFNLNFWKNRTKIFYQLAKTEPQYYQQAIDSLLTASKLAPTDAKIRYNLAVLYLLTDQTELGLKALQQAIALKPNYQEAKKLLKSL